MSARALAALLLAVALLVAGGPGGAGRLAALMAAPEPRSEPPPLRPQWVVVAAIATAAAGWAVQGGTAGALLGGAAGLGAAAAARRFTARPVDGADAADLAGGWELLAACLQAGLPVAVAVTAAAEWVAGPAGTRLRRVAGQLALGADPAQAWRAAEELPELAAFARAAGRSATTGGALAQVARAESGRLRAELADSAQARAQRAGVQITGPLGLCYLPAFLVLGVAPVVIGLASEALARW